MTADRPWTGLDWAEFGVRAGLAIGRAAVDLVAAMKGGDVHTVAALAERLEPGDKIRAHAVAVKAREALKARAAAQREAPTQPRLSGPPKPGDSK